MVKKLMKKSNLQDNDFYGHGYLVVPRILSRLRVAGVARGLCRVADVLDEADVVFPAPR
jgi:hypothetical protein